MVGKLSAFVMSIMVWDDDDRLDEAGFRKHLRRIHQAGASTYIGSSGTGDGFSLTTDEWNQVLEIAADEFCGRPGFRIMGCEPRTVHEVLRFIRLVEPYKPEALQVYTLDLGHAVKPTLEELETYYDHVLGSTDLPIVLSSFDSLGFSLPTELIERLAERHGNLRGFLYGGRDTHYLSHVLHALKDRIEVHCAGPSNAMTTLALGGNGFMGHEGNLSPSLVAGLIDAFGRGDLPSCCALYSKLMKVYAMHVPHGGSSGRSMKPLLKALGLPSGRIRAPRTAISAEVLEPIIAETKLLDLSF
ncbi:MULTISPECIES: dihydrodipicolinate synthase family protein [unclassified Mesorhizobium]|uniref:dihydrodipicolinate synthase family protein n=1 Tax=unclassified Mesorhizobium TaxID=325217 RepID=UPI000FD8DF33|nr:MULTISPECIES: dihydrodipicolinate synthase family protein [unclassified Mesorhizobium]TGR17943.1 dihydrodipicolinate synthase family protein [Mesorhizobium sp. M8A.F.Ca.ET.197.01.1.1]TGR36587.1 dihydrodipicolinate synthase family protein [bacterium M00.F.Ca.ET.199.01.1.1]TGR40134.1 dihydrodipicolinate synthase family protein [Mesorhizobium sp. M8A.F.Ca.ET.198.01.1.1]TGV81627.1 dihydrodipicolinate synthase family protein [Mesorhizobium sp. M00.F.Ca.ET.149.01.1.1]